MHAQDEVFNSFLFFLDAALLPSMGIASLKTTTYPGTLTPAPVHSHSNSPLQAPLKLCPNAPQTITPFSLPTLQAGLGYVYTLAHSQPMVTQVPSCELGTLSVPNMQGGTIILSICVRFTDAQQEGKVIDGYFAMVHNTEVCILGKGTWLGSLSEY